MAFVRKGKGDKSTSKLSYGRIRGTKPWINNQVLVSSGHRELDGLIGGGHALGTSLLIELDTFSGYGDTLFGYSVAESLSAGFTTLLLCATKEDGEALVRALPYNTTLQSNDKDESEGEVETHVQFCCSFDQGRRLQSDLLKKNPPVVVEVINTEDADSGLKALNESLDRMLSAIHVILSENNDMGIVRDKPIRIFIPCLAGLSMHYDLESQRAQFAVSRFFATLRHFTIDSTNGSIGASLSVSLDPQITPTWLREQLIVQSDTAVSVESFIGSGEPVPVEFREFVGLLSIRKLQAFGTIAPYRPDFSKYGLKRDRRKLHIEPLHLPPEESRAFVSDANKAAFSGMTSISAVVSKALDSSIISSSNTKIRNTHDVDDATAKLNVSHINSSQTKPISTQHTNSQQRRHEQATGGVSISNVGARAPGKRFILRRDEHGRIVSNADSVATPQPNTGALCATEKKDKSVFDF